MLRQNHNLHIYIPPHRIEALAAGSPKWPKPVVMQWTPLKSSIIFPMKQQLTLQLSNKCLTHLSDKSPTIISHKINAPFLYPYCIFFTLCVCKFFTWWTLMCQLVVVLSHLTHKSNYARMPSLEHWMFHSFGRTITRTNTVLAFADTCAIPTNMSVFPTYECPKLTVKTECYILHHSYYILYMEIGNKLLVYNRQNLCTFATPPRRLSCQSWWNVSRF